jgi:murein DD-endopeptidase MepM/ murein hydrolase activator NlpD
MLPQKPAPRGLKLKVRRFAAWTVLPFLGVVTTFGIAAQFGGNPDKTKIVVEDIALPRSAPSGNAATFWRNDRVQRGDSVAELLRRLDVDDRMAENYLRGAGAAESFRKLAPGRTVQAETDADGGLLALRYLADNGSQVLIEKTGSSFAAHVLPAQLEQRLFIRTGEIKTTLFAATDEANLPDPAANQLAEIFGSDIDFQHDLKRGDRFSVIYGVPYNNGEPVHAARILAAEFINGGKPYRVLYFQADNEHGDYYTPDGRSTHKAFLRSPVEFSRISSGFTDSRFHPILHIWRAHRGVDFAAPMGAKVKATGAGVVAFAGQQIGYGNLVIIKHQGRFSTAYGHLSRFAPNLRTGQHVAQGEVIGYVGKTGWATGPHLHYEFRVDGKPRNPLRVAQPDAPSIGDARKDAFLAATRDLNARLWTLHNVMLVQLD